MLSQQSSSRVPRDHFSVSNWFISLMTYSSKKKTSFSSNKLQVFLDTFEHNLWAFAWELCNWSNLFWSWSASSGVINENCQTNREMAKYQSAFTGLGIQANLLPVHWRVNAAETMLLLQEAVTVQINYVTWSFFQQISPSISMMTIAFPTPILF